MKRFKDITTYGVRSGEILILIQDIFFKALLRRTVSAGRHNEEVSEND